jgi:hypothetical protein
MCINHAKIDMRCVTQTKAIRRGCGHTMLNWRHVVYEAHCPRQLTSRKIRNHAQSVYRIPRNTGILGDRPISSLKHTRRRRGTLPGGNADPLSITVYRIYMTQATLYPVPPCCFCEESLEDVDLEPVRASTNCKEREPGNVHCHGNDSQRLQNSIPKQAAGEERRETVSMGRVHKV